MRFFFAAIISLLRAWYKLRLHEVNTYFTRILHVNSTYLYGRCTCNGNAMVMR